MPLHRSRNFDAFAFIRLCMSDWRDQELRSITYYRAGDDDHDRPILQALFLTLLRFVRPQIG